MRLGVIPQKYHMAILQDNALQRSGLHLAENARSVFQSNCWRTLGDHRRAARNRPATASSTMKGRSAEEWSDFVVTYKR
jgi:hypothetical protein